MAYARSQWLWKQHLSNMCDQVEVLLERNRLHATMKYRVKTFESLSEKRGFIARASGEPNPTIKDLLGMRIVVPFHEDVEKAVQLLRHHFQTQEIERKSEKLTFREFAYDAVHVELPLDRNL
ncbi:MAG: hypothetical protein SV422_16600, partial [Pseudomonadota bacterium]|nr:hypothetical protein [Pseudomonadota bacterium]